MALTDWILGGLRTGSNLGVEMRGLLAESWRGLYIEDWGGGEHAGKALRREMMGLLGGESAGGLGGRLLLGGVRGGCGLGGRGMLDREGTETTADLSLLDGWILHMVVLLVEGVRLEAGRGEGMGGEKRRLVAGLTLMSPTGTGPLRTLEISRSVSHKP